MKWSISLPISSQMLSILGKAFKEKISFLKELSLEKKTLSEKAPIEMEVEKRGKRELPNKISMSLSILLEREE
jgi:hypothetical protein